MNNIYINIKDVAEAKGLKSTRSLRLELNKNESKYISREVQVNGGTSYEILFSSLEPELQDKLRKNEKKTTALVPLNYQPPQFVSDQAKMTANYRTNIVLALIKYRNNFETKNRCIEFDFEQENFKPAEAKKFNEYQEYLSIVIAYLIENIPYDWIQEIYRWDRGEIALRGYMLARLRNGYSYIIN